MRRKIIEAILTLILVVLTGTVSFSPAIAQRDVPPEKGGETYSLGMPPIYKGRAGFESQWYRPKSHSELAGYLNFGVARDIGSPVVGIAGFRLEGYVGFRNVEFDGGGRLLWEIPSAYIAAGVDYNFSDEEADFIFEVNLPLRRGGVLGRGSTLALRWLPARDQTFGLGINVPLWGRNIGATRPKSDNVNLIERDPYRLAIDPTERNLEPALNDMRERARWIALLTQPFTEAKGSQAAEAMQPVLAPLVAHIDSTDSSFPAGHSLNAEIQAYHVSLDLAFSRADGGDRVSQQGRKLSAKARDVLLEEVLIPYNALLGQRKKNDSLISLIAIAQTEFSSWALQQPAMTDDRARQWIYVFQTLCDVMEENRALLRERWEDSRFVWLPLQYALKPEQHDSQAELDALIARATDQPVTHDNRIWYVINDQFQQEMISSVRRAEDYHVLWIHDFRGFNGKGEPDSVAYTQTLNYLEAMIERVDAYDDVGKLPEYFLLLDQFYFEANKSRLWLRLLSEPLDYELSLPKGYQRWERRLAETQERLRKAVAGSLRLQIAQSQFGADWLKNRVKVHVNITNPADPSFFSHHSIGILPIPDNMMRDHRKIVFYDISEEDPYRGMAMFTGMGIGEHYVGTEWEDRAIMIQGPGALEVKDAARGLLVAQGFEDHEIPYPLRPQPKPRNYDAMLASDHAVNTPQWLQDRGTVMQFHSETGFHDKPINVAKAMLYSLMPVGSMLNVPDSLWQSYIYASLLSGSALRGCAVMVIAPTQKSAPSNASPTLARAHGLLGRLIVFSDQMQTALDSAGGLLKVGLYAPKQSVRDLAGRFRQAVEGEPEWLSEFYPDNPAVDAQLRNVAAYLDSLGYVAPQVQEGAPMAVPKIHLKANFMASGTAWRKLITRPELVEMLRGHIEYLAMQLAPVDGTGKAPDVQDYPESLQRGWTLLGENLQAELTPAERQEMIYFFSVGSTNMDYRSMVMDGEVMILVGGWQALYGLIDFMLISGLCEWVETVEELDALLPPPGGFTRKMAGFIKITL